MAMRSANTSMTIAEFQEQLKNRQVVINHNYQRTDKVWPTSAKSNLIDTILLGYPVPKLILSQITDLETRRTRKEVVDGQQRTAAITEFFDGKYALTRGEFAGSRYEDLEDAAKRDFLSYELSIDLFTSASDEEIREVFRRINSYQVPLNNQETRHATHQGEFKWFMREQGRKYATSLVKIGTITEKQISRMGDLELLTELVQVLKTGIKTSSPAALTKLYSDNDSAFPDREEISERLDYGLGQIINLSDIHKTSVVSRANLYPLFAAFTAVAFPASAAAKSIGVEDQVRSLAPVEEISANLTDLAESLETNDPKRLEFATASKQGTNTEKNRLVRAKWFYRAIVGEL